MTIRDRRGKEGIALHLHELEATIMDVVWAKRLARFSVGDVLSELEKVREIAYTTVMTTLVRLHDKGVLERERDGKRYLYTPKLSREQFLETTAREILDRSVSAPHALAMLVEKVAVSSLDELDALEVLIRQRREALES